MTDRNQRSQIVLGVSLWLLVVGGAIAQRPPADAAKKETRRALVICGLPGDDEYAEQFTESVTAIRTALVDRFGFDERQVRIQFAQEDDSEEAADDVGDLESKPNKTVAFPIHGNATRTEIAAEAKRLDSIVEENDTTWVFVLGQAYYDGKSVFLNVPDADISHQQFGKLFAKLKGQATFVISTPASGYYIKSLSKKNRVVITSAEADAETNGSIFHVALAKTLTELDPNEADVDGNGNFSLLDLYVKTVQNMTDSYFDNDPPLIPTEHPLLDDDGDGRGSELQIDYLTMAQGGRSDSKRKRRLRKFKDGKIASMLVLPLVASE